MASLPRFHGPHPEAATDVLGKSAAELAELAAEMSQPRYRGKQLYHALYAERVFDFARMSALPSAWRAELERFAAICLPRILRRYLSADGSVRYLLEAGSAAARPVRIEAVFMPSGSPHPATGQASPAAGATRQTLCISTQAGCAVDCHFCLTAQLGLLRNLTAGEIVGQVLVLLEDQRGQLAPQTNVVLMGQGEPLLNYEAVMAALRILLDPQGVGLSPRHVTLSTAGIVPGIQRLAAEPVRPRLAISLNASEDVQRDRLMPINRKYPLAQLLEACRQYPLRSWERLTFEYVLLGGVNDRAEDARRVAKLLAGLRAKLNLIPWNPGALPYEPPRPESIEQFREILQNKGLAVFVRYSRGQDVMAACGQLASLDSSSAAGPGKG